MNKIRMNKEFILQSFCKLCEENNIWYSLDNYSLLFAVTGFNYTENLDYHEVMMTFESYEKLKQLFPDRVIDNTKSTQYFDKQIKFLHRDDLVYTATPFLNINLVIPTTVSKVKKYLNTKNKLKDWIYKNKTFKDTNISSIKFNKIISKFLSLFIRKNTYKALVNILYDKDYEGFFVLSSRSKNIVNNWINNITYRTTNYTLKDIKVHVLDEYKEYLTNVFGELGAKYENITKPINNYQYINTVDYIKLDSTN
ncbi:hypothetical protein [Mycoplasma miroungirhinis]|uniref:Lipopolysaccharide cholinephosphotransferase n=1 Tax=Mycoplasma miroungirhinis TaxID=754516 RepID=A0A6M4JBN8_9MOLU|nr:hypothetical protein [Mycoplasma miroungirhinis]QJR44374.1 hypothetical protein HLA92_02965 [Mycoplasma miroungirhinis]